MKRSAPIPRWGIAGGKDVAQKSVVKDQTDHAEEDDGAKNLKKQPAEGFGLRFAVIRMRITRLVGVRSGRRWKVLLCLVVHTDLCGNNALTEYGLVRKILEAVVTSAYSAHWAMAAKMRRSTWFLWASRRPSLRSLARARCTASRLSLASRRTSLSLPRLRRQTQSRLGCARPAP